MVLHLKQLGEASSYGEKTFDFSHSLDLSAVKLWGEHPFLRPVRVKGTAACRHGVYSVSYGASSLMSGVCSRCLSPVEKEIQARYSHTVLTDGEGQGSSDGFVSAPGGELDLDGLVISDILLRFGGVMLCEEDCKGLCAMCGKNLNEGGCGCVKTWRDPRFDALREWIEEGGQEGPLG